jgi:hypothetical protein
MRNRMLAVAIGLVAMGALTSISAQPHTYVLPKEIALTLLGSYDLDKPTTAGAKELHVTIVDTKLRLRIGDEESQMVAEGVSVESTDGVKSADIYGFTVVGKPGLQLKFRVADGRVKNLLYSEDFAKPPLMISGFPKK